MHKTKRSGTMRDRVTSSSAATASAASIASVCARALEQELRAQGHDDLADDLALGPVAASVSLHERAQAASVAHAAHDESDADDCTDEGEEEIEDILDEDGEDDDGGEDDDAEDEGFEDEDDDNGSFEESLSEGDDSDDIYAESRTSNPISPVILDVNRKYSTAELEQLRGIANLCIARNHLVPNAKALLHSIKAYESKHRRGRR